MQHAQPKCRPRGSILHLRWPALYVICSGALTLIVLVAVGLATCRPEWYAPAAIDRVQLKSDKADFANLLDRIGAALNAGEAIEFEITEDQLNRWLAARGEIWPALRFEVQGLRGIQISLLEGDAVRLAATASQGPLEVVLSVVGHCRIEPSDGEPSRTEPSEVVIDIQSMRAGKMPIPSGKVLAPLHEAIARSDSRTATMTDQTIRLGNHWIWKNGHRPFRLDRLEITPGLARIRLAPASDDP